MVASIGFCDNRIESGRPTVVPLPIIKTLLPDNLILYSFSNAKIALGVQGMILFTDKTRLPKLTGFRPSASFFGSIASKIFSVSTDFGNGN